MGQRVPPKNGVSLSWYYLQPVPAEGGHGPILRNDTQGAQAVSGPQLSIGRAVSWSNLHCP